MFRDFLSEVLTCFDSPEDHFNNDLYGKIIRKTLGKILPETVFQLKEDGTADLQAFCEQFQALLPYVSWALPKSLPGHLSFFVISRYRSNAFRFFFEMVTHWLIPGKRLNAVSFFAGDFSIHSVGGELYTLCEVVLRIEDQKDLDFIQSNLNAMEAEIRLGMSSSYQARRILEIRGMSAHEKIALVQERIANLIKRLPNHFDYDLISEMQHLFVMCRDEFKAARMCQHLTRMICVLFFFRKKMKTLVKEQPAIRHVNIKTFRCSIEDAQGKKQVLGVAVGVNFLRDKEVFEKRHLLTLIRLHIPEAIPVEGSYVISRRGHESFCHLYFEIQKTTEEKFTASEIKILHQVLPLELKDLIEQPVHPVFMPRNEEEVMRNVLILSNQIKYVRDIPQVVINFDEQTHSHLFFNVIIVQVVKPEVQSLQEMFFSAKTRFEYLYERTKTVGFLRNKYSKEAVIFRVKQPKDLFLRRDHSIDLYKARQAIVKELSSLIGDIRDFNGGMIAKQNETLDAVRDLMIGHSKYNEHLLENFFFSIMPPVIRTLIEPVAIRTLFLMVQELADKPYPKGEGDISHIIQAFPDFVFVAIRGANPQVCEEANKALNSFHHHSSELASALLRVHEVQYLGYIYRCDDAQKQLLFCKTIENALSKLSD